MNVFHNKFPFYYKLLCEYHKKLALLYNIRILILLIIIKLKNKIHNII